MEIFHIVLMERGGAVLAGLIVLVGTILSMFIGEMAWYNAGVGTSQLYLNAFGGGGGNIGSYSLEETYFAEEIIDMLPGILAAVGGLLLITRNRAACMLGSILVLAGCGLFVYAIASNDLIMNVADFVSGGDWFWYTSDGLINSYMRMGYGWITSAAGGVLGLIFGSSKD